VPLREGFLWLLPLRQRLRLRRQEAV